MDHIQVTLFENAFSRSGRNYPLNTILEQLRVGEWRQQISRCRHEVSTDNLDNYSRIKSTLPAVTFCGTFIGGHKVSDLETYNSLLVIDLDDLLESEIKKVRLVLSNDPYVFALWVSPSGRGLKGLVKLQSSVESHKLAFAHVARYFYQTHGVILDRSGSDVSRLCYVSWDPELFINNHSLLFELDTSLVETAGSALKLPNSEAKGSLSARDVVAAERALFYRTEGRNRASDRVLMKDIIKFLSKKHLSITGSHSDWIRVGLAVAGSFTFDIGEEYFLRLCRLDGEKHNEQKSKNLIHYCYRNRKEDGPNMGTIIFLASQRGFKK